MVKLLKTLRILNYMLINILLGFLLPWIFGIYIYKRDKRILITFFPVGSLLAFIINEFGFYFEFWYLTPILKVKTMSALPMNLGIYPVLACYLVYLINSRHWNSFFLIILFSGFTTGLEFTGVITGKVGYMNHWNTGWTFVSYFVFYILVVWYYQIFFHLFKKTL